MEQIEIDGKVYKLVEVKHKSFFVYKIEINGKVYIGECAGKTPSHRKAQHRYDARTNKRGLLCDAIREFGDFELEVVATCDSKEQARDIERQLISEYDARNPEKGYNKAPGTMKGFKHSEESKLLMSESNKGKRKSPETEFKKGQKPEFTPFIKGHKPWNKGKSSPIKLSETQIEEIKKDTRSIRELAKIYKVGKSTIQYHKSKL